MKWNGCGWMTTFAAQIERHIIHTMGLTFVVPGMYRYFDLPDLSAAVAPRALMVEIVRVELRVIRRADITMHRIADGKTSQ